MVAESNYRQFQFNLLRIDVGIHNTLSISEGILRKWDFARQFAAHHHQVALQHNLKSEEVNSEQPKGYTYSHVLMSYRHGFMELPKVPKITSEWYS